MQMSQPLPDRNFCVFIAEQGCKRHLIVNSDDFSTLWALELLWKLSTFGPKLHFNHHVYWHGNCMRTFDSTLAMPYSGITKDNMMKNQRGFTLIELAIVLVIIGLLLGGVLKGQELINSAKVKNMANDFKNIQILLYGYQDKFKAIPGDDAGVAGHVTGGTVSTAGGTPGNARIEGEWDSVTTTHESFLFWQHVRLAGLAPGSATFGDAAALAAYIPRNTEGGRIGIQSIQGFTEIDDMTGVFVVCSDGIVGKLAKQLDVTLDDGETSTGTVMAKVSGAASGTAELSTDVDDSTAYTVCMSF